MKHEVCLVWFRRDLRCDDHAALAHALRDSRCVHCVFVFDREILDTLPSRHDRRVEFMWRSVRELRAELRRRGGALTVLHGHARREIPALATALGAQAVYANRDYEPQAVARDRSVADALARTAIKFTTFKDQVIFENDELLAQNGQPYRVFTPYKNAWLKRLQAGQLEPYRLHAARQRLACERSRLLTLRQLGFATTNLLELGLRPGMTGAKRAFADFKSRMARYHERRDFPAERGPSYLSIHLRFGTLSIRALVSAAWRASSRGAAVWLSELIWRDFFFMVLHHHPRVVGHAFQERYDDLVFPNSKRRFRAWCEARTGYPLIDAAMRQINQTGYMHNRLRMAAASFLVKDLHVDWRWGERYFAQRLNDFDLAANNGNWQWVASTGCDAQPYFRIFNPINQSRRFDPNGDFIREFVPELARCNDRQIHAPWLMNSTQQESAGIVIGRDYPAPIVDHAASRRITLALYRQSRFT